MKSKMVPLTITLPADVKDAYQAEAAAEYLSLSDVIRRRLLRDVQDNAIQLREGRAAYKAEEGDDERAH